MSELLDKILSRNNMLEAYKQVKSNKGSAGIDGVTIEQMDDYLHQNWRETKQLIKERSYKPQRFSGLKSQNQTEEFVT